MSQFKIRKRFYIPLILLFLFGYIISAFSKNIEVKYVYKICPAFVVYTDDLKPEVEGSTKGIICFIKKENRNNNSILKHELTHVKQEYRTGFQNWLMILFSDRSMIKMECEAYASETKNIDKIPMWANFIKNEYHTNMSEEEIKSYLLYYWKKQNL